MKCKYKASCGYDICMDECCPEFEGVPLSNGDRIRAMSDEELTTALLALSDCSDICQCTNCTWHTSPFCNSNLFSEDEIYGWLKQPAEEDAG